MIKVLFTAPKYDYCNPALGVSNEYLFFYEAFKEFKNVEAEIFDWVKINQKYGRDKMNEMLYEKVKKTKPDIVFFTIFEEEFKKDVVKSLSKDLRAFTFNVFSNDDWQFDTYSSLWAPQFSYIATDVTEVIKRYKKIGYKNVTRVHWGINPRIHKKLNLPKIYDASFVGQAYGNRKGIIRGIKSSGINITSFGRGFESGKLPLEGMVKVFNQSKINLNISEHSRKLQYAKFLPDFLQPKTIDISAFQMKARTFEVAGCGGFLLTSYGRPLEDYYKIGKEIETYKSFGELTEKMKFYLENEKARERIANAGYEKTIKDYTYKQRVKRMFSECGFKLN